MREREREKERERERERKNHASVKENVIEGENQIERKLEIYNS